MIKSFQNYERNGVRISAYRGDDDEPHRIARLEGALGFAAGRFGEKSISKIAGVHDHKGKLTVIWVDEQSKNEFFHAEVRS